MRVAGDGKRLQAMGAREDEDEDGIRGWPRGKEGGGRDEFFLSMPLGVCRGVGGSGAPSPAAAATAPSGHGISGNKGAGPANLIQSQRQGVNKLRHRVQAQAHAEATS